MKIVPLAKSERLLGPLEAMPLGELLARAICVARAMACRSVRGRNCRRLSIGEPASARRHWTLPHRAEKIESARAEFRQHDKRL
jgi:hypothetical protein